MLEALSVVGFAVACAAADRLRGTDHVPALLSKGIYAVLASLAICNPGDGYFAVAFVALFIAGASPGWGRPLGLTLGGQNNPPLESWQQGPLENTEAALVFRGAMWLAPASLLYFFTDNAMYLSGFVSMTCAFVVAPYIAREFFKMPDRWAAMEYIRGALFGLYVGLSQIL